MLWCYVADGWSKGSGAVCPPLSVKGCDLGQQEKNQNVQHLHRRNSRFLPRSWLLRHSTMGAHFDTGARALPQCLRQTNSAPLQFYARPCKKCLGLAPGNGSSFSAGDRSGIQEKLHLGQHCIFYGNLTEDSIVRDDTTPLLTTSSPALPVASLVSKHLCSFPCATLQRIQRHTSIHKLFSNISARPSTTPSLRVNLTSPCQFLPGAVRDQSLTRLQNATDGFPHIHPPQLHVIGPSCLISPVTSSASTFRTPHGRGLCHRGPGGFCAPITE